MKLLSGSAPGSKHLKVFSSLVFLEAEVFFKHFNFFYDATWGLNHRFRVSIGLRMADRPLDTAISSWDRLAEL